MIAAMPRRLASKDVTSWSSSETRPKNGLFPGASMR
jgi:hypothetical protein